MIFFILLGPSTAIEMIDTLPHELKLRTDVPVCTYEDQTVDYDEILGCLCKGSFPVLEDWIQDIQTCIDAEASLELTCEGCWEDYLAALWIAVRNPNAPPEILQCLIDGGARLDNFNKWNQSALSLACEQANPSIAKIRLLVAAGLDPDLQDNCGMTPLTIVMKYSPSSIEVMQFLAEKGANLELQHYSGKTILYEFCRDNFREHSVEVRKVVIHFFLDRVTYDGQDLSDLLSIPEFETAYLEWLSCKWKSTFRTLHRRIPIDLIILVCDCIT